MANWRRPLNKSMVLGGTALPEGSKLISRSIVQGGWAGNGRGAKTKGSSRNPMVEGGVRSRGNETGPPLQRTSGRSSGAKHLGLQHPNRLTCKRCNCQRAKKNHHHHRPRYDCDQALPSQPFHDHAPRVLDRPACSCAKGPFFLFSSPAAIAPACSKGAVARHTC